jgi:uncharacterized membrane-anchored protein
MVKSSSTSLQLITKIPAITLSFWVMKICATTLGETAGDLLSMTLNMGYALSSLLLMGFFFAVLTAQLATKSYKPAVYWAVILATSTAGTTLSDFLDRTVGLGYATGSALLILLLLATLLLWKYVEDSVAVSAIQTRRGELFYWTAIVISNTLGTALGDYLADNSGLGFGGGALLIGSLLTGLVLLYYYTACSRVLLFWLAFVLTRPFGATFGDLLTKPAEKGGLNFGTIGTSALLFLLLIAFVIASILKQKRDNIEVE